MGVLLLNVGAAWADTLDDAMAAHNRGDYSYVLRVYEPLAAQGNTKAQSGLGYMYLIGAGRQKKTTQKRLSGIEWLQRRARRLRKSWSVHCMRAGLVFLLMMLKR